MIFTIAAKDLKSLFTSPIAWVVLTFVQLIAGYGFLKRFDDFLEIQPQLLKLPSPPGFTELVAAPTFSATAAILLFAVPLLAMRLIAEGVVDREGVAGLAARLHYSERQLHRRIAGHHAGRGLSAALAARA